MTLRKSARVLKQAPARRGGGIQGSGGGFGLTGRKESSAKSGIEKVREMRVDAEKAVCMTTRKK